MASKPILFTGIKNDFGNETKFMIYMDLTKTIAYTTDFYIENNRFDAKIDPEKGQLTLGENVYDYNFKNEGDEILLVATEELDTLDNMFNYLFCRSKPNFMLGTNKMEV